MPRLKRCKRKGNPPMFRNFASSAFVVGALCAALVPTAAFARGGGGHGGGGGHSGGGGFSGGSRGFSGGSRGYSQGYAARGFSGGGAYAAPRGYSAGLG